MNVPEPTAKNMTRDPARAYYLGALLAEIRRAVAAERERERDDLRRQLAEVTERLRMLHELYKSAV